MRVTQCLTELNGQDLASAGGKGTNLATLVQAGFAVPEGFAILTSAYQIFIEKNNIQQELECWPELKSEPTNSAIERFANKLQALFRTGRIPEEIAQAILSAYQQLGGGPVAVRSSATVEDLTGAAFAGQYKTCLNVSQEEVLAAVQSCWASLWTPHAISYRLQQQNRSEKDCMAVIVQKMVPAKAAGVLFTVDPTTGYYNQMMINAVWGLGETLVSGQATPDTIIIDKASGQSQQIIIGEKQIMAVAEGKGIQELITDEQLRQQPVLTSEQIEQLTRIGLKLEGLFGAPQDIEWAIADESIFLVQTRPITTLTVPSGVTARSESVPPGDDSWDREQERAAEPFDLWTRTNVGENLPFPVTPLTVTNFATLFNLGDGSGGVRRFYGRLYINEGAMIHRITEEFGLPTSLLDKLWGSRRRLPHSQKPLRPLRLVRKILAMLIKSFAAKKSKGPKHTPEQFFAQIDEWVKAFSQRDLSLLDDRALLAEGLPVWQERGQYAFSTNLRISMQSVPLYGALERLVKWCTGGKDLAHHLVTGLSGMYNAEVGPMLWKIAQIIKEAGLSESILATDPATALAQLRAAPLAQPVLKQLEQFLQRHGHRCPNELELLNPRWSEAPEQVLAIVARYLQMSDDHNPEVVERRQRQRRQQAITEVEQRLDPLRRPLFRFLLKKTQQAVTIRDNSRYYMIKFMFPMRKLYARLGQRWMERGWLVQADDIFFLTVAELQTIVECEPATVSAPELQTRVAQRRLAYEYWFTVIPPDAITADGMPIIEVETNSKELKGTAASSGRVRGRARIVQTIQEALQLDKGDILVTRATDPGWSPVFPLISGMVLEIGGQLSHGAIIAREYAIPAVINMPGALHTIHDGQMIVVDGSSGSVYLEVEEMAPE